MNSTFIAFEIALVTYNICFLLFINKEGTYPTKSHYILNHSCTFSMYVFIVSILYSHYISLHLHITPIPTSHSHTINRTPQITHTTISHHNYNNSYHHPLTHNSPKTHTPTHLHAHLSIHWPNFTQSMSMS